MKNFHYSGADDEPAHEPPLRPDLDTATVQEILVELGSRCQGFVVAMQVPHPTRNDGVIGEFRHMGGHYLCVGLATELVEAIRFEHKEHLRVGNHDELGTARPPGRRGPQIVTPPDEPYKFPGADDQNDDPNDGIDADEDGIPF